MLDSFRTKIRGREIYGLKLENLFVILLLLAVSLIFPIMIFERIRFYNLPVGGDIGAYLRISYAIFEPKYSYTMWGDNLYQYPPLLFFIIYPVVKVMGDVWAINIIGLFLLVLRPLAVFIFINKLFKSRFFALLGAGLEAFSPTYYGMYAWGGYDNLFGFVVLPVALIYVFQHSRCTKLRDFIILTLFSTIAILSHHLTSIVFLGTICLWQLPMLIKKQFKSVFLILLSMALPLIIYRLSCGGASDLVFFNEFAYYGCTINMQTILSVFKDLTLLMILLVLSSVGIYEFFRIDRSGAILLLSWLLCPILFYVGIYYTRLMAIDYVRLLYFLSQPLIISTVYTLKHWWEKRNKIVVLALMLVLLSASFNFGFVTMNNAIYYYKGKLEDKYSDVNSYDMVIWVKENVPDNSTVVVRASIIYRFIEGMAHKRILTASMAHKYLFKAGQYERALACEDILTSNILGCSDMFIIKEQTPILFSRTPYIFMFAGDDYKLLGHFADGWGLKKLTLNVSKIDVGNDFYRIRYTTAYSNVETVKTVVLGKDEVKVNYIILGKDKATIANTTIIQYFWLPVGKSWDFENNTLVTDYGNVEVITNAISIKKDFVSKYNQQRLVFSFNDELTVTFKVKDIRMVKGNTVITTRNDLIKRYGVTHALVRVDDQEAMKWIQSTGDWKLIYNNTLFYLYSLGMSNH